MAHDGFRPCEYVRIKATEDELVLQAREEAGRGKRFGTAGEVALDPHEAELAAKWILTRSLDA